MGALEYSWERVGFGLIGMRAKNAIVLMDLIIIVLCLSEFYFSSYTTSMRFERCWQR